MTHALTPLSTGTERTARRDCFRAGRNEQMVVFLDDRAVIMTCRHRSASRVDVDYLVAGSKINIPFLTEFFGGDRYQILERLNLDFNVMREPTGAVRDLLTLLEDDVNTGIITFHFAGC